MSSKTFNRELFDQYRAEENPKRKKVLRDTLVMQNYALSSKLARHYARSQDDIADMMQLGAMGLMRALEKYDPNKGSFSTYAVMWIHHFIGKGALDLPPVRTPKEIGLTLRLANKAVAFESLHGRPPTLVELNEGESKPASLSDWDYAPPLFFELNRPPSGTKGEFSAAYEELQIPDDKPLADTEIDRQETHSVLNAAKATLSPEERLVIEAFAEETPMRELLATMKTTEDVVKRLRESALAKLRAILRPEGVSSTLDRLLGSASHHEPEDDTREGSLGDLLDRLGV